MNHVVSFSSGLSSALTATRVIERYGNTHTSLVFMDTLFEDEDNYRFMAEFEQKFNVEIIRLVEGRTPYEVSRAQHVIPNQKLAPCTFRLKIEVFRAWLDKQEKPLTVNIGYDFSEMHRCEPTRKNYESLGYSVDFPLLWQPIEYRPYTQVARENWGIEPPRMYVMGYTHANCGGRCVKQGQGDWLRTLSNFPERYAEIEMWEQEMRDHPKRKDYALLRSQTNGNTVPRTLTDLRKRYEGKRLDAPLLCGLDEQSACVHCWVEDDPEKGGEG